MTSSFTLYLDTAPPAEPELLINGGAAQSGSQNVLVALLTADFEAGARDVTEMKIWGDVDPTADPLVQPAEADSAWTVYAEDKVVRLSGGTARKRLYARLRDDVGNETVPFTDFIDLDLDIPVVSITTPINQGKVSKVAPHNTAVFSWEADRDFAAYEVRVVPSEGSPQLSGVVVPETAGSVNTADTGVFPANIPITTLITGTDLEAASPGDTAKTIKVFVRDADGTWSA